jgi:hypothetical protein
MHDQLFKVCNIVAGKAKESSLGLVNFSSWSTVVWVEWAEQQEVNIDFTLYCEA